MVIFQKIESLAILVAAVAAYYRLGFSWPVFFIFLLMPDISMVGYLLNAKTGAIIYNIGHSYFSPIILAGITEYFGIPLGLGLALVWTIHIAADRMMGFGLKLPTGFHQTHLGTIRNKY